MRLPVPSRLGAVDYSIATPPSEYHCGKCGVVGVKLWRDYQTFLNHQSLLCGRCACAEQSNGGKAYLVAQSPAGRVSVTTTYDAVLEPKLHEIFGGQDVGGDQIGWRVPAVPTADGETYWGYTSVPDAGVAWWNRLPLTGAP